jgi:hypothetical protein
MLVSRAYAYRERARRCDALARRTSEPGARAALLYLKSLWLDMADAVEAQSEASASVAEFRHVRPRWPSPSADRQLVGILMQGDADFPDGTRTDRAPQARRPVRSPRQGRPLQGERRRRPRPRR